jgi:hypothetical protein
MEYYVGLSVSIVSVDCIQSIRQREYSFDASTQALFQIKVSIQPVTMSGGQNPELASK